jgi:hypothetical protein
LARPATARSSPRALWAAYTSTNAENRPARLVTVADDWRLAVAATPLIARPTNAAVVIEGFTSPLPPAVQTPQVIRSTDPVEVAAAIDAERSATSPNVLVVAAAGYRDAGFDQGHWLRSST